VLDENAKLLFVEEEVWDTIWLDDDENTPSSTTIETLGYMFEYNDRIDDSRTAIRLCTSWATKEENIQMLIGKVKDLVKR